MKKHIVLLCSLFITCSVGAQTLSEAESAFQKNDFANAKTKYEALLPSVSGAEKNQVQLRLAACEYHLGEFLQAAKTMRSYPLPEGPLWQARFLLYRIYTAQQASEVFTPILNQNEIDSPQAAEDPTQWTRAQWQEKIDQDYRQLWDLRKNLAAAPIEQENLILNLTDTDTRRIPTLFDFTVNSWITYLKNHSSNEVKPLSDQVPTYLGGQAQLKEGTRKNNVLLQSQLLEAAAKPDGENRQDAALFWQTDLLLFPLQNRQNFVIEKPQKALSYATAQLRPLMEDTPPAKATWWERLKQRFSPAPVEPAKSDYARGYMALQLAHILQEKEQYAEALEIANLGQKSSPSFFVKQCQNIAEEITRVSLTTVGDSAPINRAQPELSISGKNLKQVFVRVYKTSFEELTESYNKRHGRNGIFSSWNEVSHLSEQDIASFLTHTPLHQQTVSVPYKGVGQTQQTSFNLPALEEGLYVVLMSTKENFSQEEDGVFGWMLNATDLAVFATAAIQDKPVNYIATRTAAPKTLEPNVFHVYTLNLRTGQPEPLTPLRLLTTWNASPTQAKTNNSGIFDTSRKIIVSNKNAYNENYSLDVLAQKGDSIAYLNSRLYFYFSNQDPVKLFAQTDRPIYRPGQKVYLSVQGFERLPRGLKTLGGLKARIYITDPNGKRIFSSSPLLNNLGNAQAEFTLPENALLGHYSIAVSLLANGRTYSAYHSFSLEEYKRPDYELTLEAPTEALSYDKKAVLSGTAKYYFGAPLENAKVTYTLKRRGYVPPFYWWWFRPLGEEKIIDQGQTVTNEKGTFEISFVPTRQEEDEEFANYELNAQVYDESGRAISATRSYKISAYPHLFKVEFTQGFYDANKAAPLAKINLVDADGTPITGELSVSVSSLENRLPKQEAPSEGCYRCTNAAKFDELYQDFTAQETIFKKQLSFQTAGEQTLELPALPEGVYRLELSGDKATTQKMAFIVAEEKSSLQLPDVALAQHATYYPGETMRVLVGAGNLQGVKQVEVYQQGQFLTHRQQLNGGVGIFTLPITDNHRGGLFLRWFGASDYQLHTAQTMAQVPFDNKKLTVQTTAIPSSVKPGQTVDWKVDVKDAAGKPVNGLINATVYDKSLDYYVKNRLPFQFDDLYSQRTWTAQFARSHQGTLTQLAYYPKPIPSSNNGYNLLPLPSINLQMMHRSYISFGEGSRGRLMMAKAAAPMAAMEERAVFSESASTNQMLDAAAPQADDSATSESEEIPVRTDFSETAYFNPALPFSNGQALLRFTLPQSLTTWNILGFALTANADFGGFNTSTISRKDVMVRLQLPRFYREEDKGVIQVAVTNQTEKPLATQVSLNISKEGASALAAFGITRPNQTVTVEPNRTQFVSWDIRVPVGPALYTLTAVARSGRESDGEQKTIPVLPGKTRLLTTTHKALQNGDNDLILEELLNVPAQQVELTSLTINPSLALSVLNSLPNLLNCPFKDLVSSLNRYVPLAVVHQFYTTYPQLKKAVKKLPKRTGLTPSWDEQDPLRLQLLEQTPWLRQAQGRQANENDIISLFDDTVVSSYLEKELKNINRFQNASGAFSWFAGGPDDDYLTLYALESFAQAMAYKATVPQANAQKAIDYIIPRIEKRLNEDKEGSVESVSYALYAAYTLSSFPANWTQIQKAKPYLKNWMEYAESQAGFMTPLGQIYAAAVYYRLNDDVKANEYLDLVLSRIKTDPLTGAYFAPEAQSWVWYNDTITSQTVVLRTLLEMRPQSDKIQPLMQWLLFNRQVNDWTNSKAASQAVFTLLDVMQTQNALSQPTSYAIEWAGQTQNKTFQPFDWTEDLRFVRQAPQITETSYIAQINRQGPTTTDFASLAAIYETATAQASPKGVINVERAYFLREKEDAQIKLRPLAQGDTLHAGDEVEVHLTIRTDSAFEYVLLQDPKPAGFESKNLLSGWTHQNVSFYREEKDATTNFFINRVPNGALTLRYTFQPTVNGELHVLPAQVQSMYAPEYGAHSDSTSFTVEK